MHEAFDLRRRCATTLNDTRTHAALVMRFHNLISPSNAHQIRKAAAAKMENGMGTPAMNGMEPQPG